MRSQRAQKESRARYPRQSFRGEIDGPQPSIARWGKDGDQSPTLRRVYDKLGRDRRCPRGILENSRLREKWGHSQPAGLGACGTARSCAGWRRWFGPPGSRVADRQYARAIG